MLDRKSLRGGRAGRPRRRRDGPRAREGRARARAGRAGSRPCSRGCSSSAARGRSSSPSSRQRRRTRARIDLRDLPTFTIDPDTAKDFDDAISVVPRGRRRPRVGAHRRRLALRRRPARRSTAALRASGVLDLRARPRRADAPARALGRPLLAAAARRPAVPSPSSSRRAGEPTFYRSVIRSDARLTYGQAQRRDVPAEVADELELAAAYSAELRRRRFARGALRVEPPEVAFEFDGQGGVANATWRGRARGARARRGADDPRERGRRGPARRAGAARRSTASTSGPTRRRRRAPARQARRPRRADAAGSGAT